MLGGIRIQVDYQVGKILGRKWQLYPGSRLEESMGQGAWWATVHGAQELD